MHETRCVPWALTRTENTMNTIIYIVGAVVIIGVILSYFGLR
jgi:predicted nucleic acid-binding Zn ribbon protein